MKRRTRVIKLLAFGLLAAPALNDLLCTTRQIEAATSSGIQTLLNGLFANFSKNVANGVTGNQT
ncbi:MAG TPA: hypothetical protein VGM03_17715 [Phycisphaerae bacterium]|jgi:hypothetical protein